MNVIVFEAESREASVFDRLGPEHNVSFVREPLRNDAMYIDKLDGRIEEGFYKRMRAQWRDEQERCERDIERQSGPERPPPVRQAARKREAKPAEFPAFELDRGAGQARRRVQGTF